MSSAFDNNAVLRRPPHLASTTDGTRTRNFTTAGAGSTAVQDLLGANVEKSYVVMRFAQAGAIAGTLIGYIAFGDSGMDVATVTDWAVYQGETWEWLCLNSNASKDRYFRFIRAGAVDTTIQAYLSDVP